MDGRLNQVNVYADPVQWQRVGSVCLSQANRLMLMHLQRLIAEKPQPIVLHRFQVDGFSVQLPSEKVLLLLCMFCLMSPSFFLLSALKCSCGSCNRIFFFCFKNI